MMYDATIRDLNALQSEIKDWADLTFGYNGKPSILASIEHLKDEVDELGGAIEQEPDNIPYEFADCFIILMHCAKSCRMDMVDVLDAVEEKMDINRRRTWGKPDSRGVVNHIEE